MKCPLCELVGSDYQRTRAHFKTLDTDIIVKMVLTNQCLVCETFCTDSLCARQRCRNLHKHKRCPAQNRAGSNTFGSPRVKHIEEEICSICNEELKGHEEIREHFTKHLLDHVGHLLDIVWTLFEHLYDIPVQCSHLFTLWTLVGVNPSIKTHNAIKPTGTS